MLRKLIKYELKASGRILLPIYLATIILALLSGIFYNVPDALNGNVKFLSFLTVLVFTLYGLLVFAEMVVGVIISVYRFKTNLFDAEGYLMHTLPVKTHSLVSSKLIVAVIYQIMGVVVAMLSGALFLAFTAFYKTIDFTEIGELIKLAFLRYNIEFVTYGLEAVILVLLSLVGSTLVFYASVSVGHMANSRKVAKSVGAYIGFYFISQNINFWIIKILSSIDISDYLVENMTHKTLVILILAEAFYSIAYYIITNYCMKNKLNLQ